jgi:hypothetical protein
MNIGMCVYVYDEGTQNVSYKKTEKGFNFDRKENIMQIFIPSRSSSFYNSII